jgi:hypothetical protein
MIVYINVLFERESKSSVTDIIVQTEKSIFSLNKYDITVLLMYLRNSLSVYWKIDACF